MERTDDQVDNVGLDNDKELSVDEKVALTVEVECPRSPV